MEPADAHRLLLEASDKAAKLQAAADAGQDELEESVRLAHDEAGVSLRQIGRWLGKHRNTIQAWYGNTKLKEKH